MLRLVPAIAACVLASACLAQTYEVRVGSGSPVAVDSGDDAVVDLGAVTEDTYVHIYDPSFSTNSPDDSAGKIMIRGSASGGAVVYVWVADITVDQTTAFSASGDQITEGLRDLTGIEFVNPDDPTDTSLRDHAAVAVSIVGDLTGYTSGSDMRAIVAGTLFRIDVRRSDSEPIGGRILGDLVATMPDSAVYAGQYLPQDAPAIGVVRAGWQIAGNIVATSTATFDVANLATWSTVRSVAVGPNLSSLGISGDILAEKGYIGEIFSTGQIGTSSTVKSQIKAGVRIGRVSIADADLGPGPVLDKDIFANIDASVQQVAAPTNIAKSSLYLLETAGNYVGDIHLHDIYGELRAQNTGPNRAGRQGILIGGDYSGRVMTS